MLVLVATVLWLTATSTAADVKHGTIGYGINMFHPFCCTACSDSLAMVYLNCTTFEDLSAHDHSDMDMKIKKRMSMDMGMSGTTSEECYASNQPFQQTLAYCIKSHCDAENISYDKQNTCFQLSNHIGSTGSSLQQSQPTVAPTEELAEDAEWLNTTMLVNEAYWSSDRGTIEVFEEMETQHVAWSIAILVVSVAVPLLTGAYMLLTSQLPLSRRRDGGFTNAFHTYIALPAFGSKRHSTPLPWKIGYLPSRAMTIWITLYILINILASAVGYRSVQPSSWYKNTFTEIGAYVTNRAGVLSFANMALAILFAARNNPLLYLSAWDQTTQITFHRWAARVAVVQAIVHSIIYTADFVSWEGENTFATEAALPYLWWGIIATTAMGLMIVLSALPLRMYAYEVFLISHIVLAVISLLGCWYHIAKRFQHKWGYEVWLYLAFAFWAYDRLVRVGKTVYHSISKRPIAKLESVEGTNAVMMTIALRKPLRAGPGKHTYVYFPSSGKFWESHPFTICDWSDEHPDQATESIHSDIERSNASTSSNQSDIAIDKTETKTTSKKLQPTAKRVEDTHYIRCLFRAHKGMTTSIHSKITPGALLTIPIAIEGTYGGYAPSHFALNKADTVLCIAGGIGITHISSFARQYSHDRLRSNKKKLMPRCSRFEVAWSVRELGLLNHGEKHLLPDLGDLDDGSVTYKFFLTDDAPASDKDIREGNDAIVSQSTTEPVQRHQGRMDVSQVVSSVMSFQKRTVVLVCGPSSLADDVRAAVAECSRRGYVVDLIEESFSW